MKRVSVYVLVTLSLIIAATINDWYMTRLDWVSYYRNDFSSHANLLSDETLLAKSYLQSGQNLEQLTRLLQSRVRVGALDFWVLYHDSDLYQSNLHAQEISVMQFVQEDGAGILLEKQYAYNTRSLSEGFTLVAGLRYNEEAFVSRAFAQRQRVFFIYLAGLTSLALLIFFYFFNDIFSSIHRLGQRQRSFSGIQAHSKEANQLLQSISAFAAQTDDLEKERNLLRAQVLPSLRSELASGLKPPYDFNCTLVRTDINNFSKIYHEFPNDEFAALLNDFFSEASQVIARYKGLVHEFVGDEVIYYFKDQHHANSVAAAISAIRDIGEVAAKFNRLTTQERGYSFTVKSSLAHGRIRYGHFVNGFNMAGSTLIETVRVLSHVREKDGNVLVFDERHLAQASLLCTTTPYAQVELKGFQGEKNLIAYQSHHPLATLLEKNKTVALAYYRSDFELVKIVQKLEQSVQSSQFAQAQSLIKILNDAPLFKSSGEPKRMLLNFLESALKIPAESTVYDHTLGAALSLLMVFVTENDDNSEVETILFLALKREHARVVANALDVITHFNFKVKASELTPLLQHENNRVVANTLRLLGRQDLSTFLIKRLAKMLRHEDASTNASARFALNDLRQYYQQKDPVYLSAQAEFMALAEQFATAETKAVVNKN